MKLRPWITTATLMLVATSVATIGLDGCTDDGTGDIPNGLYAHAGADGGSPDDPGVTTQTTPTPGVDATVDVIARDSAKPPPKPKDSGGDVEEAGMTDSGDAGDSG